MKIIIIYTYYKSQSADYNLSFYVKKELSYKNNIDYIIVINGFNCDIKFPKLNNLKILKRDNIGFDFGGHNYALKYLKKKDKTYDYYFFMNSGVIGPIIPHYLNDIHWSSYFINKINNTVKLVGTTIVCLPHNDDGGYGPKVEGFFFMTDKIGLKLLKNEKTIFYNHKSFYDTIINGEYGLSNCIIKNGYSIDCMLHRYQGINWLDKNNWNLNNNTHPSRKNSFYNTTINPYEVIFHKWFWHNEENVSFDIIEQYVNNHNFNSEIYTNNCEYLKNSGINTKKKSVSHYTKKEKREDK
jgi:hypothetical protein